MTSTILFRLLVHRPSFLAGLIGVLALTTASSNVRADEPAAAHPVVELWPGGAPGAKGTDPDKDVPSISVWLPRHELATGAAVVVCPGGGYGMLAVEHEGKQVAEWLNKLGIAAFVLKYRLGPRYHHPGDARRRRPRDQNGPGQRRQMETRSGHASPSWAFRPADISPRPPARISAQANPTPKTRSSA